MSFFDLFVIALALSMDAFAVSICKGLSAKKAGAKHILTAGVYFGGFQALMPLIGFLLGYKFERFIVSVDQWIAFVLLAVIGGNMIKEALGGEDDEVNDSFSFKTMLPLALATSIDALAVGISFAFLGVDIVTAALLIGVTTFVISGAGIVVGNIFGAKYKSKAELAGGIVLILIGLKILLEHLGIIYL